MKDWIRRAFSRTKPQQNLFFKSPGAAIEFASHTFDCTIRDGTVLPVLVLDVEGELAHIRYPTNNGLAESLAAFPTQVQYPCSYINCLCMAQFAPINGVAPAALICSEIDTEYSLSQGWKIKRRII